MLHHHIKQHIPWNSMFSSVKEKHLYLKIDISMENTYIDYDIPLHWNAMVIESEEIYVWWYGKISRYINKGKIYVTD